MIETLEVVAAIATASFVVVALLLIILQAVGIIP